MESSHFIIDASVFVALYRDIDAQHSEAFRTMNELLERTLVVHPYIIQETATVLTYKCGVAVANRFLADIAVATNVIIPAVDVRRDMQTFVSIGSRISFADAALIALAKQTGGKIVTFDKQILSIFK